MSLDDLIAASARELGVTRTDLRSFLSLALHAMAEGEQVPGSSRDLLRPDSRSLAEDVTGHCMAGPYFHVDGRECVWHHRLGCWVSLNNRDSDEWPRECLRDHRISATDMFTSKVKVPYYERRT